MNKSAPNVYIDLTLESELDAPSKPLLTSKHVFEDALVECDFPLRDASTNNISYFQNQSFVCL